MEAHYTISACVYQLQWQRGVWSRCCPTLSFQQADWQNHGFHVPPERGVMGRVENKIRRDLIKALHLQCLDTGGTSELPARPDWDPSLHQNSSISHIRRQALPEGFIYQQAVKTVRRKARHQPSVLVLVSANANALQINSRCNTMEVCRDKGMKWGRRMGVAEQKSTESRSANWFQRESLTLDLLPSSFQIAT